MNKKRLILLLLPFLSIAGCKSSSFINGEMSDDLKSCLIKAPMIIEHEKPEQFDNFYNKMNNFSSKISYSILSNSHLEDNVAISPMSLYFSIAMLGECATSSTRDELLKSINVSHQELIDNIPYLSNLLNTTFYYDTLSSQKPYGSIKLTNSVWFQEDIDINQELINSLSSSFDSYLFKTDFYNEKYSQNVIQEFIRIQTNGIIDNPVDIDPTSLMLLINNLYFKDCWDLNNGYLNNNHQLFINEDKTTKYVDLLEGLYYPGKVYVGDKFKTFYTKTSADYQLSFLVPDIDVPIFDVFTEQNILEMANREYERLNIEEKKSYMTNVLFPEFSATFDASVKTNFYNDLGIRKVFVPNIADFSNINENIPLFVSDINQKTSFNVNKTGIEGASVSGVTVAPISPVPEYEIVNDTFIVNRSFGFVLTKDKNILFSGVVQKI